MLVENDKIDNFALEIDETKDKNNSCISNKKSKLIILIKKNYCYNYRNNINNSFNLEKR